MYSIVYFVIFILFYQNITLNCFKKQINFQFSCITSTMIYDEKLTSFLHRGFFCEKGHDKGIGPIISTIDSYGDFVSKINAPKNKIPCEFETIVDETNRKVTITIPIVDKKNTNSFHLAEKELQSVFFTIPLPKQNDQILRNRAVDWSSLIKKICVKVGVEALFSWDATCFEVYLKQTLGVKKFSEYVEKFLTGDDELVIPIIFNPTLKPWYLSSRPSIELSLNPIDNLYCKKSTDHLTDVNFKTISSCGWYLVCNDIKFFDLLYEERRFIERPVNVVCGDFFFLNFQEPTFLNCSFLQNKCQNRIFFDFEDETFCEGNIFYGSSVDESKRIFLASCVKPFNSSNNPSLFCLKGSSSLSIDGYKIEFTNKNSITLTYNKHKTIIYTDMEEMPNFFFDLCTDPKIKIFWFKSIRLNFSKYNEVLHKLKNDVLDGEATGLKTGYFVVKDVCFNGISNYEMNFTDEDNHFFDTIFSQPVGESNPSHFAKYKFVQLKMPNFRWQDLDRKHMWKIKSLDFKSKDNVNQIKKISSQTMKTSCLFDLNMQTLCFQDDISSNSSEGYVNFGDYDIYVEMDNSKIFETRQHKLKLRILAIGINALIYRKGSLDMLDDMFMKRQSESEGVLDFMVDNGVLSNAKKIKNK